jgi:hypothetical protein
MARDGSGTYTLPTNSFAEPVTNTTISPADAASTFTDFTAEFTDSLSRSGKGGMSADLDMNNNDINNTKTVVFKGSSSGNTTVQASAAAGTTTLTLPAATATLATTSNKLSAFAATTSAELAGVLSDETGSGAAVFGTSPALTTPVITGVSDGSAASAGIVGEWVHSNIANASAISLSSGVTVNVTSINMTAGDWDVWIQTMFQCGATTNVTFLDAQITTTSATLGTIDGETTSQVTYGAGYVLGAGVHSIPSVRTRFSLASPTTVYFVAQATFSVSTCKVYGSIQARRMR